jgi:hypothetical protein
METSTTPIHHFAMIISPAYFFAFRRQAGISSKTGQWKAKIVLSL